MNMRRDKLLTIRITEEENEHFKRIARARGMTVAGWIRHVAATTRVKPQTAPNQ